MQNCHVPQSTISEVEQGRQGTQNIANAQAALQKWTATLAYF
jgi:hypothetical protein